MAPKPPQIGEHSWMQPFERSQYFEDNPRQAFNAFMPQFGTGQKKQSILNSFGTIFDQYLGQLGRNVMGGGEDQPQGGWGDFLMGTADYDKPFDFDQFYRDEFVGQSAANDARYDPSIRYLY